MSLQEFYGVAAAAINDSDVPYVLGPWEEQSEHSKEVWGILYALVSNGAFEALSSKKRATKRYQSKLP